MGRYTADSIDEALGQAIYSDPLLLIGPVPTGRDGVVPRQVGRRGLVDHRRHGRLPKQTREG
jgi:hypothetical protein